MKRRVLKFDRFLVWVFTMNAGERKDLKSIEVTRGLTKFGPQTINPISVFVRGSFMTVRDGREPYHHAAGTGGARFLEADSPRGHSLVALEDDSEYHCITPRDHFPRFWERGVTTMQECEGFKLRPNSHLYVASGKLEGFDSELISTGNDGLFVEAEEYSVVALMWTEDGLKVQT